MGMIPRIVALPSFHSFFSVQSVVVRLPLRVDVSAFEQNTREFYYDRHYFVLIELASLEINKKKGLKYFVAWYKSEKYRHCRM